MNQLCIDAYGKRCDHAGSDIDHCTCDIIFETRTDKLTEQIKQVAYRVRDGVHRDYATMYDEAMMSITHRWSLHRGNIIPVAGDPDISETMQTLSTTVGPNQVPVPAPFNGTIPVSTKYVLNSKILDPYKTWDEKFFASYCNIHKPRTWYEKHIWKKVEHTTIYAGTPWDDTVLKCDTLDGKANLLISSLRMASFYNMAFAGGSVTKDGVKYDIAYSKYAQEDLYPTKITKLLQRYNKPTHKMPALMMANKQILPMAVDALAKHNGWKALFGSVPWSYEKAVNDVLKVSMMASSGGRPGPPDVVEEVDGVHKHVTVAGKKMEQVFYAARVIDEAVQKFRDTGVLTFPPAYHKIVLKSEIQLCENITYEAMKKAQEKAREYFIPDLVTILISQLTQGYRQKIERSPMIEIGRDWNRGGMEDFAKKFRYEDPEMRYVTFDITGYDTSVLKIFLEVYSRWAKVYMKFDTNFDRDLYMALLQYTTQRLTTKVTQIIGNVWRVIDGVMPSGAYETSHGDSWITGLAYFCFFIYMSLKDMRFKSVYNRLTREGKIILAVYGDDNVFGFHKDLLPWITEGNMSSFFKGYCNFELRDFCIHEQFLSVADGKGGLKSKGVVFLQKYAILTPKKFQLPGMPKVVHYRPIMTNMRKFAKGSGDYRTDLDYFLSSLTGVYDNPFNQVWYDACAHFYKYFKQPDGWKQEINSVISKSGSYVTRLLRKMNMNPDKLFKGFPTVQDIIDLSLVSKDHHKNVYRDEWTTELYDLGSF